MKGVLFLSKASQPGKPPLVRCSCALLNELTVGLVAGRYYCHKCGSTAAATPTPGCNEAASPASQVAEASPSERVG